MPAVSCLEAGRHVGRTTALGYTLLSLDRPHDAYRYLRYYTELTPANAWAWCFRGQAAEAIREPAEARDCYQRAVELERDDLATDAANGPRASKGRGAVTRGAQLIVSLTYSRSALFGWHRALMKLFFYTSTLYSFHDACLQTTVPVALTPAYKLSLFAS